MNTAKRKNLIVSLVALLVVAAMMCFLFTACTEASSPGKSAYEIACDNGFIGTEQEWLNSLKGQDGANGQNAGSADIYNLFDAYKDINPDATFEEFLNDYLSIDYYDIQYAAAKGIQSAVSIYCTFERSSPTPGKPANYSTAGAGVVYRISGNDVYIITNYHVLHDNESNTADGIAKQINVYSYGFEYSPFSVSAEFAGGSITKDIAVIKAPLSAFKSAVKAAELGDSNDIALGERTVAIGNPSAEGISITSGIVSVDSEEIEMDALDSASNTNVMRVIRTDTPINSGNSGGGLYNSRGQLLGIVNAKSIVSGVDNIGYAIPVNIAVGIADSVIENDSKKCLLGVTVTAITSLTQYNAAKGRVEIVETITVESVNALALADGKLLTGDKLVSVRINGGEASRLTRIFHLSDFLYKVRGGDTLYLGIIRNGTDMTIELSPAPANFVAV